MDDDIAAALAGIRENFAMRSKHAQGLGANPADFRRLLKAVEDALKLTARWQSFGDGEDAQSECAGELRAAITAALTGQDAGVTRG